jgi:hypothetical protein
VKASTFPITRKALAELEQLALAYPAEKLPADLTYRELQQVLTLTSLLNFFEQHGIELPYHMELQDAGPKTTD